MYGQGSQNGVGSGGFAIWGPQGNLIIAEAHFFGLEQPTNNAAELAALE